MKIIDFKKYAVGFVMGLCFVSGYTFASGINGTIGSLFEQLSGGSWVLNGANIKSDTVDSDKIKSETIVAGDIAGDTITSSELADSLYIQNLYSDNLYINEGTTPKRVATEEYVTSRGYLTSVPSTYATKNYVTTRGYITNCTLYTRSRACSPRNGCSSWNTNTISDNDSWVGNIISDTANELEIKLSCN